MEGEQVGNTAKICVSGVWQRHQRSAYGTRERALANAGMEAMDEDISSPKGLLTSRTLAAVGGRLSDSGGWVRARIGEGS